MPWVAGADGCKAGWVVILYETARAELRHRIITNGTFGEILDLSPQPQVVAVDMIVGLLDAAEPGGRECERAARRLVGNRRNSIFSAPVRGALCEDRYPGALAANRVSSSANVGISKQCFNLFAKMRELEAVVTPALQDRVYEVHPELSFREMRGQPMRHPKRTVAGQRERRTALRRAGFRLPSNVLKSAMRPGVAADDVLDACACCWTAARILRGEAIRIPDQPPVDARGLRMELWR